MTTLRQLDNRGATRGTQFNYSLTTTGKVNGNCKEPMDPAAFGALLDSVEENLLRMGREIYEGRIALNPYQKGSERACDKCDYAGVCRIDPWKHEFRVLK